MAIIQVLLHNKWMSEEYCIHPLPYVSRTYPRRLLILSSTLEQAKHEEEHNGNVGKFLERFLFLFLTSQSQQWYE